MLGDEHLHFIDDAMAENDELTNLQLYNMFQEQYPEISQYQYDKAGEKGARLGGEAYEILCHDSREKQGEES